MSTHDARWVIVETRYWYGPRRTRALVEIETGTGPVTIVSRSQADAWVSRADGTRYELAHNESARPSYRIVRADSRLVRVA